jgi:mannose-1-phosphate guanylyltransferase
VLHDGVIVGAEASVNGSVLGPGASIGPGCVVSDAIVGAHVRLGAANELRAGIRVWSGVDVPDRGITFTSGSGPLRPPNPPRFE